MGAPSENERITPGKGAPADKIFFHVSLTISQTKFQKEKEADKWKVKRPSGESQENQESCVDSPAGQGC